MYYFTIITNLLMSTLPANQTKKARIRELLDRGDHQDKEIAKIACTSLANVAKEKSIYAKESGKKVKVSRERTEVKTWSSGGSLSRTDKQSIEIERDLLSIPPLPPDQLKILYTDLAEGKTMIDIIKERGFHPQLVEIEYNRSVRSKQSVPYHVAIRIFPHMSDSDSIKGIREKFDATQELTLAELDTILGVNSAVEKLNGFKSLFCNYLENKVLELPECCERPLCNTCREPVDGVIFSKVKPIKDQFSVQTIMCSKCALTLLKTS